MKRVLLAIILASMIAVPVKAVELSVPTVPSFAEEYMPPEPENLLQGIRYVLGQAVTKLRPDIGEAYRVCLGMIVAVMLVSILQAFRPNLVGGVDLAGTVVVSGIFLSAAGALMDLGAETVFQISEYGKLLIPVMTAALAAQGGVTSSTALYAATALFDSVLSFLISRVLMPILFVYLALSVAHSAVGEDLLKQLRDGVKWLMTWLLKTALYIYTGFISITGVVSGPTDAAAMKAAKLTISGFVPVVGGILSDASEAILVSASAVKNAMGLYGLFAILAIWIGPFLKIGAHYLMLRFTATVCSVFGSKRISGLIQDFSAAMGFLLAMTGSICLMLLISTICFMRGVA